MDLRRSVALVVWFAVQYLKQITDRKNGEYKQNFKILIHYEFIGGLIVNWIHVKHDMANEMVERRAMHPYRHRASAPINKHSILNTSY